MSTPIETPVSRRLASVKNIIIVLSGKGGVGKSSSSVQLALSLLSQSPSTRVGLLDLDITGPSLPRMVGLDIPDATVHQSSAGWVPVYVDAEKRLGVMSIGFLLKDRGDSVVWRGPKKDGMIRQFLSEVRWGELDYLVVDTPPGTSDEHISLLTHLHPLFAPTLLKPTTPTSILITTPQVTSINDTIKSLSFTRKLSLPVMGLVENMSGYVCPCCDEISDIYGGQNKVSELATKENLGYLGKVPIDTNLVKLLDSVSKGEIPAAAQNEDGNSNRGSDDTADVSNNNTLNGNGSGHGDGNGNGSDENATTTQSQFPLLDKYNATASSKVWKGITDKLIERIEERKSQIRHRLENQ
ncbi:cytosolic Fe-S cluster assembly factor CFD1 [Kwoniella dejecticola CBS 10117]|uniref:Cytosolic Fe-S cluster assembly factor CFD1 n=1 Tax=Kwoniella dejecticola CBS 10117 TaxID=1296121 RepID=A0A1A6A5T4_9TREE|nr:cytosolic Fe-S cluster assembly factor CFD1 [Kwoniella dejecticola CBS 10117]OBR85413.1 cytosolic Fe-S cluster assembly factor CFD1 [Kwoniella dejecticola CBS 10117]